jgi:hypothetical protein
VNGRGEYLDLREEITRGQGKLSAQSFYTWPNVIRMINEGIQDGWDM